MDALKMDITGFEDHGEIEFKTEQLTESIKDQNIEMVESLLQRGVNPNAKIDIENNKMPIIIYSVETEQKDLLELLIKYKAEIDITDSEYDSSLHHSVNKQNIELVKILVNNYC